MSFSRKDYVSSEVSFLEKAGWPVCVDGIDSAPTLFSPALSDFYLDLYGNLPLGVTDILTARLAVDDEHPHSFESYSAYTEDDIFFLLSSIRDSPVVIYPGTFSPYYQDGQERYTARSNHLLSLNGVCVDIDPARAGSFLHCESIVPVFSSLPAALHPDYLCLSGSGVHLWYVFEEPMQTFGPKSGRRRKLLRLYRGLYDLFASILPPEECSVDEKCASLYHAYRAPGTVTKYGDIVLAFKNAAKVGRSDPVAMSTALAERGFLSTDGGLSPLVEGDKCWLSYTEIAARPITERQAETIVSLHDQGLVSEKDYADFEEGRMTGTQAWETISRAVKKSGSKSIQGNLDYSSWKTKPHGLISGSTGGVYRVVLDNIVETEPGNRYNALRMLAGVAYMMTAPSVSRQQLEVDMRNLLETPWARAKSRDNKPLSEKDIQNALSCYSPDNRQTVKSVCKALGFNPFGPAPKRNYRPRAEHLNRVAEEKVKRSRAALAEAIAADPTITKKRAAEATGLSYSTVCKHWEAVCKELGIDAARRRGRPSKA